MAWFLAGALLLGVGQQLFVVLRNPWLVTRGWQPSDIPAVQATSAAAGVVAGLLGVVAAGRVSLRGLLVTCGLVQAAGFGLQIIAPGRHAVVLLGALLGGFAIQLNTAATPPFLRAASAPRDRATVFSAGSIALFAGAGLLGLLVVWAAGLGSGVAPATVALTVAVVASALAAAPFGRTSARPGAGGSTRVGPAPSASPASPAAVPEGLSAASLRLPASPAPPPLPARRWTAVPGATPLILLHGLLALAGGITVPILQLWFTLAHGTRPAAVAGIYATTMVVAVAGHSIAPALARRFGLWRSVLGLQLAAVPLLGAMAVATSLPLAVGAFLLRHVTNGMGMSLLHLLGQEAVGERHGAALASLTVLSSSAAWALGSALAGPLLRGAGDHFGWVFAASIAVQVVAVGASALVLPRAVRAP